MNQRPGGAPDEVLVLTSTKATPDFFMAECQKRLPRLVPRGLTISIRRLQERAGKEKLHNRYVLTDIGGIVFGVGLDEGDPTSNDDLNIMSAEQYTLRHRQYLSSEMEFDIPEAPVTVVGIAKA